MPPSFGETHRLSFEQQMVYTMMVAAPSMLPAMPFNEEAHEVGVELKGMFHRGELRRMHLDPEGVVRVFAAEDVQLC